MVLGVDRFDRAEPGTLNDVRAHMRNIVSSSTIRCLEPRLVLDME
jgi:hypothetical protein